MARKVIITTILTLFTMMSFPINAMADNAVNTTTVKGLIVKHANEMGVDPAIALSIAKAESGYCHEKRSRYGAVGVFQLMPSTAKKLGYNPYHIQENIKAGISYYKMMYKMFGSMELALAAYNAGPGNVKKYNGVPPFVETKKFVSSIIKNYHSLKASPDPVIADYKNALKDINFVSNEDFRYQHEAILKEYLSTQGI